MTDDIVTMIRRHLDLYDDYEADDDQLMIDAATEIERLRAAGDALAKQMRLLIDETLLEQAVRYGSVSVPAAMLRACTEWEQARRDR